MSSSLRQRLSWEATKAAKAGRIDAPALQVVRRLVAEPPSASSDDRVERFAAAFFAKLGGTETPPTSPNKSVATPKDTPRPPPPPSLLESVPEDVATVLISFLDARDVTSLAKTSFDVCTRLFPPNKWRERVVELMAIGDAGGPNRRRIVGLLGDAAVFPDVAAGDRAGAVAVSARGIPLLMRPQAASGYVMWRWIKAHFGSLCVALTTEGTKDGRVAFSQRLFPRFVEDDDLMAFPGVVVEDDGNDDDNDDDDEEEDEEDDRPQPNRRTTMMVRMTFVAPCVGVVLSPSTTLRLHARFKMGPVIEAVRGVGDIVAVNQSHGGYARLVSTRPGVAGFVGVTTVGKTGAQFLGEKLFGSKEHFLVEGGVFAQGDHGIGSFEVRNIVERVETVSRGYRVPGYLEVSMDKLVRLTFPVGALFEHCAP